MKIVNYYDELPKRVPKKKTGPEEGRLQKMMKKFYNSGKKVCEVDRDFEDEYKNAESMRCTLWAARISELPIGVRRVNSRVYLIRTDM